MEKEMAAEAAQNLRTVPDTFGLKFSCARLSKLAVHDKKKGDCWQTTLWYSIMLNDERPTMFSSHAIGFGFVLLQQRTHYNNDCHISAYVNLLKTFDCVGYRPDLQSQVTQSLVFP